jgi:hypothetical protein
MCAIARVVPDIRSAGDIPVLVVEHPPSLSFGFNNGRPHWYCQSDQPDRMYVEYTSASVCPDPTHCHRSTLSYS